MRFQSLVELAGALFRKEDACRFELDPFLGAGDGVLQPARPLHVEVDIVRGPGDQRRCLYALELIFDLHRVAAVEGIDEAFDITRTFGRAQEGMQIGFDSVRWPLPAAHTPDPRLEVSGTRICR